MTTADIVRNALQRELRRVGLPAADPDAVNAPPDLLSRVLALAFPEYDFAGHDVDVAFESEEERERIEQALLFGWATAEILRRSATDDRSKLLCALFNLGIGMIDSLCDAQPQHGSALLEHIRFIDVESAAIESLQQGRMLASLPADAREDPTIAFTARVIDAFYSLLHATHAPSLRRSVGRLLAEALAAEQRSITRSPVDAHRLVETSRKTSVIPFLIIATLVQGDMDAATHLGEAMWRIDDLIDLDLDAQSGALNSLLVNGRPDSAAIEATAREAADHLRAGLAKADGRHFLSFVHHYARITPESSTLY